jgi:cadmium resistance protein CadD (predicted permease)
LARGIGHKRVVVRELLDYRAVFAVLASAVGVFVATNIDDLVVLTALFGSRRLKTPQIVAGQYLGMGALVAISVVAAAGLATIADRWVGLLGIVPLALGIRGLFDRLDENRPAVATSAFGVAAITIANGADNVSVYTPVFRQVGRDTVGYIVVFAVLVACWLAGAAFLASRKAVVGILDRWGQWIIPCVFIAIGATLLISTIPH